MLYYYAEVQDPMTGQSVSPISQVRASSTLLLSIIVGNRKVRSLSGLQSPNFQTKFHGCRSTGSKVERGTQTEW